MKERYTDANGFLRSKLKPILLLLLFLVGINGEKRIVEDGPEPSRNVLFSANYFLDFTVSSEALFCVPITSSLSPEIDESALSSLQSDRSLSDLTLSVSLGVILDYSPSAWEGTHPFVSFSRGSSSCTIELVPSQTETYYLQTRDGLFYHWSPIFLSNRTRGVISAPLGTKVFLSLVVSVPEDDFSDVHLESKCNLIKTNPNFGQSNPPGSSGYDPKPVFNEPIYTKITFPPEQEDPSEDSGLGDDPKVKPSSGDDQPASDHPASDHPASDHPASDHPASDHPASDTERNPSKPDTVPEADSGHHFLEGVSFLLVGLFLALFLFGALFLFRFCRQRSSLRPNNGRLLLPTDSLDHSMLQPEERRFSSLTPTNDKNPLLRFFHMNFFALPAVLMQSRNPEDLIKTHSPSRFPLPGYGLDLCQFEGGEPHAPPSYSFVFDEDPYFQPTSLGD